MNLTVLNTLYKLAMQHSQDAVRALAREIAQEKEGQSKLELLTQYHQDYRKFLDNKMTSGLMVRELINFQGFINNLETAVVQQNQTLATIQQKVKHARSNWQACEKKRLTYEALIKREKEKLSKKEALLDQKLTDEFASRKYAY